MGVVGVEIRKKKKKKTIISWSSAEFAQCECLIIYVLADMYASMFRYWKEMEQFTREHPDLVHTLMFEDMKAVS